MAYIKREDVYNAIQITTDNFGVAKKVVQDTMLTMLSKIETVEAIPKDKVKHTREEIQKLVDMCGSDTVADLNMKSGLGLALEKIDKLIESEDKDED